MAKVSIEKLIKDVRYRAQRRKSPWNLILIPFSIAGMAFFWWLFALPIFYFQNSMNAENAFLSSGTRIGLIMFYIGLGVTSVGPGLMIANVVAWIITPARLVFNREAEGHFGTDLRSSMTGLMRFSLVVFFVAYPISFIGGLNYYSLSTEGIFYRKMGAFKTSRYSWNEVQEIKTRCWTKRAASEGEFILVLNDDTKIDLFSSSPRKFFPAYPALSLALKGMPFQFNYEDFQPYAEAFINPHRLSCSTKWSPYFKVRPGI
jgi:hypothetical protein